MRRSLSALLPLVACAGFAVASRAADTRLALPFIDDDSARAVAEARARDVPIFVEYWAPW